MAWISEPGTGLRESLEPWRFGSQRDFKEVGSDFEIGAADGIEEVGEM